MQTTADFQQEKGELEALLASGIFGRAPSLAQLLTYVCEKYFEGDAGRLKEYSIAVEAFGRPAEFDQKRDSIVRVEAHRLRKRLKQYYETQGAGHSVQIAIPPGQYAPKFIFVEPRRAPEPVVEPAPPEAPAWGRRMGWIAAAAIAAASVVAIAARLLPLAD